MKLKILWVVCVLFFSPADVFAQVSDPATQQKLDRLQRDLQILQRQIARGESHISSPADSDAIDASAIENPAQLEVKLSTMDDEIRRLRGKVEESEFQFKKLNESLEKLQKDTDFRFNELATKNQTTAPANGFDNTAPHTLQKPVEEDDNAFESPKEHYNYAYRLINQTKYDEAAKSFDSFIKKYPKDPLVGNAYYWLGETFYIHGDYVASADNFRQGFEELPAGPKASDNLFKLAMSLSALKREKEACIVLSQLVMKFKKVPGATDKVEKAAQEQKKIGCK